jgi:glycosyltransferase involved in cell wall biosynthesis
MEAKGRELGIEKKVVFTGTRADVPRLMLGAMDVFLFPSLWEGLPIAFLEAQAAGLRCVVSDAVPSEASALFEALEYVPLAAGADQWAMRLLRALERGALDRRLSTDSIASSPFLIGRSAHALEELYENATQLVP